MAKGGGPKQQGGGPKQPNMNELLKQAQKMQQQMIEAQASAAEQEVEGQAGGGMVKVRITGAMEFKGVTIDPAVVDPDDIAMLEDLVLAAIRDASARAGKLTEAAMGGLNLGGLGGGLGLAP